MAKRRLVPVASQPEVQQPQPEVLPDKLLKVDDVIRIFGVSRSEVTSLMQRGLPHYKLGKKQRNLRFDRDKLAAWLAEQQMNS